LAAVFQVLVLQKQHQKTEVTSQVAVSLQVLKQTETVLLYVRKTEVQANQEL
jgi:hypothetical protein